MKQNSLERSVGWQSVKFTSTALEESMRPIVLDSIYLRVEEAVFVPVYNLDDALDNMVLRHF
jgi:hypothetical protein